MGWATLRRWARLRRRYSSGIFVHSKTHDHWLQILRVSTTGAKFGKAPPDARLQVGWDFTGLVSKQFVPLPFLPGRCIFQTRLLMTTLTGQSFWVFRLVGK